MILTPQRATQDGRHIPKWPVSLPYRAEHREYPPMFRPAKEEGSTRSARTEADLLSEVDLALGRGHGEEVRARAPQLREAMRPLFASLPRTEDATRSSGEADTAAEVSTRLPTEGLGRRPSWVGLGVRCPGTSLGADPKIVPKTDLGKKHAQTCSG